MPYRTLISAASYLVIAEFGAALLGSSGASAQERITLETIGAVRMATAAEVRRPKAQPRQDDMPAIRETPAERPSQPR